MICAIQSILRSIKRQAQSQFTRSRCSGEGLRQKAVRAFWAAVYFCYAAWVGITFLRREVLGEYVIYRGRRCVVNNWANSEAPDLVTVDGLRQTLKHCNRSDVRTIHTPATYLFRVAGGFTWWADNWFNIAVDKRLYPAAFADREVGA